MATGIAPNAFHLRCERLKLVLALVVATTAFGIFTSFTADAAEESKKDSTPAPTASPGPESKSDLAPRGVTNEKVRNFYQVLEDVLGDFEYDLKNGQVRGLKDLSVRNIATSENVPPSFKQHIELLVTERVLQGSRTRVLQCLPCRSKKATLSADNVLIQSPDMNPAEQVRLAQAAGIQHFLDIAFAYQASGMILSMTITEAETGSIVWSRSYNSETSRAAAFRRGVDYSQVDEARKNTEYVPTVQYRPTVYYLFAQDTSGLRGVLGFGCRINERYDNRKKEVGFELSYGLAASTLAGNTSTATTSTVYGSFNLTLLFVHAWNLIGDLENYNQVRGSIFAAMGGTYASGFLGGVIRGGYEWRMGKHWAVMALLGFRPSSTLFVGGTSAGAVSGIEFGVGVSALL